MLSDVAMSTQLTFSNTPEILSSFDNTTIGSSHIFRTADNRERHGSLNRSAKLNHVFVVLRVDSWLIDLDVLSDDNFSDLNKSATFVHHIPLTICLNVARSSGVMVSALAITGIKLTRLPRRFMTSISKGLRLVNQQVV
jgi:hypothetical protein